MVSLLPISSHVALPLISEQTETSAAALVLTSHHITSSRKTKKARKVSTTTIDVVRHAICKFWVWSFQAGEGSCGKNAPDEWWLISDVEHHKTILLESFTAGSLILKNVSKCQDMTFYSPQSLSKLSSICITLTKIKFAPISHPLWHFDNPNLLRAPQTSNQCARMAFPDELWQVVSQCCRRPFLAESLARGQTWDQARSPTGFNAKVQPKEAAPTSEAHPNLLPRI